MNRFLLKLSTVLTFFAVWIVQAQQPTIGVQYHDMNVSEGYTLFTPNTNNFVYLIDNCGQKVNQWTFDERPALTCYLLENGNLLRAGSDSVEIRDWDNNVVWSYLLSNLGLNQHHDIEPLPNGNVLCIITDRYTADEMIAFGRNPAITGPNFRLDKIIELQPNGIDDATIVWEWKFKDHLIQDFDASKANFGIVADHPELINLNFDNGFTENYTHVNGMDYNANLDQIIISVRHFDEIMIIDHSTTTSEAASHTGGNSNRGGDLLWRWGNPQTYGQGTASDQKLFKQHDSKWVQNGYLDEGKITVFNNGGDGTDTFSSVHIITPNIIDGSYEMNNNLFLPNDFEFSWNGTLLGEVVKETIRSGAHSLPNGNMMICESSKARISEITKSGTHLWSYVNPSRGIVLNQFEIPAGGDIFRGEKYPVNYPGFDGRDLTPQGIIENENSVSENCISNLGLEDWENQELFIVNPVKNKIIRFNTILEADKIVIIDINGRIISQFDNFVGQEIKTDLQSAMYFMRIYRGNKTLNMKLIVE